MWRPAELPSFPQPPLRNPHNLHIKDIKVWQNQNNLILRPDSRLLHCYTDRQTINLKHNEKQKNILKRLKILILGIKHLGDSKSISIEGRIFYGIAPHPEAKPLILFKNSRIANRYSQFAAYLEIAICNSPRKWGSLFAIRNILPTNCRIVTV